MERLVIQSVSVVRLVANKQRITKRKSKGKRGAYEDDLVIPLTAYPAFAGGAAKRPTQREERVFNKVAMSADLFTKDGNQDLCRTRRMTACLYRYNRVLLSSDGQ